MPPKKNLSCLRQKIVKCMQLTTDQLQSIATRAKSYEEFVKIVQSEFLHAEIFIIQGHDTFAHETYIAGAAFSQERAQELINAIPPNSTSAELKDTYHVRAASVGDIVTGKVPGLTHHDHEKVFQFLWREMVDLTRTI